MNDYPISPKSIVQYGPANLGRKKFNKQEEKGLNLERWSYFFCYLKLVSNRAHVFLLTARLLTLWSLLMLIE